MASRPARLSPTRNPLLVAVLVFWVCIPFLVHRYVGQDAMAFLVAGELAAEGRGDEIYVDGDGGVSPRFREVFCGFDDACAVAPFVAPPSSLVLVAPLQGASFSIGQLAFRLVAVSCAIGGMVLLNRRLAGQLVDHRMVAAATAVLLTPLLIATTFVGQNSPILFLLACLPLARSGRRWDVLTGALLAVAIALKVFPLVLVGVAVLARRWAIVASAVIGSAVLAVAAVPLAGWSAFPDFLRATGDWDGALRGNLSNGSLTAAARYLADSSVMGWLVAGALLVVVLALRPRWDPPLAWGAALALVLAFHPQVWAHYLFLCVAGVAAACLHAGRAHWAIPLSAGATIPAAWFVAETHATGTIVSVSTAIAATALGMAVIARRAPRPEQARIPIAAAPAH